MATIHFLKNEPEVSEVVYNYEISPFIKYPLSFKTQIFTPVFDFHWQFEVSFVNPLTKEKIPRENFLAIPGAEIHVSLCSITGSEPASMRISGILCVDGLPCYMENTTVSFFLRNRDFIKRKVMVFRRKSIVFCLSPQIIRLKCKMFIWGYKPNLSSSPPSLIKKFDALSLTKLIFMQGEEKTLKSLCYSTNQNKDIIGSKNTSVQTTVESNSSTSTSLFNNFKQMSNSDFNSDVVFMIEGESLEAHKSVLSTHSKTFRKMFEVDVPGALSYIPVEDCDFLTFNKFLLFLYTGKMETTDSDSLLSLYMIADKYDVSHLCKLCIKEMYLTLTTNNAVTILKYAHAQNKEKMKITAKKFISHNFNQIGFRREWAELVISHPDLISEISVAMQCQEI